MTFAIDCAASARARRRRSAVARGDWADQGAHSEPPRRQRLSALCRSAEAVSQRRPGSAHRFPAIPALLRSSFSRPRWPLRHSSQCCTPPRCWAIPAISSCWSICWRWRDSFWFWARWTEAVRSAAWERAVKRWSRHWRKRHCCLGWLRSRSWRTAPASLPSFAGQFGRAPLSAFARARPRLRRSGPGRHRRDRARSRRQSRPHTWSSP